MRNDFTHRLIEDLNSIQLGMDKNIQTLMETNDESSTYDYSWDCTVEQILNPYGPEDQTIY
jgi:hypothetical protein